MDPPFDVNHKFRSAIFPAPSHSTVRFEACRSIEGAIESAIVNVAVVEAVLPHSSEAVKVISDDPVAPQRSLNDV